MTGNTHRLVGLEAGLISLPFVAEHIINTTTSHEMASILMVGYSAAILSGAAFGGVYPDCDLPESIANSKRGMKGVKHGRSSSREWADWRGHRAMTHSLVNIPLSLIGLVGGTLVMSILVMAVLAVLVKLAGVFTPLVSKVASAEFIANLDATRSLSFVEMFGKEWSYITGIISLPEFKTGVFLFFAAFCTGYVLHLMMDSFTYMGIPWLHPFLRKRFNIAKMRVTYELELPLFIATIVTAVIATTLIVYKMLNMGG